MTITNTLTDIRDTLRELQQGGSLSSAHSTVISGASGLFELAAAGGPFEEVLICRSLGLAHIYMEQDRYLYIVPNGKLHLLNGQSAGWYTGVFQAGKDDLGLPWPPAPSEPFDKPGNNVPNDIPDIRDHMHPTKAVWKFDDGWIFGVGPANSYTIQLKGDQLHFPADHGGGVQLVISIAMVITGGTKQYRNAKGTITSLGATWFPDIPGESVKDWGKTGALFEAKGVHCFRIMREEFQARH